MARSLLIYGATGYTGKLLVRAAVDRGISPVLAGRNGDKLRELALSTGLEARPATLNDPDQLDRALSGIHVVLNAAGPFSSTALPLIEACLRKGVHYLDISGEVATIDQASRRSSQAKAQRIMLMPGVGFDVVPSDCLAAHVVRRAPSARRLFIGVSGLVLMSRGSAKTMIELLTEPVWVRRRGLLEVVPPASSERSFDYGSGPSRSIITSWADVASAYFSTGVPDVTAFFEATVPVRLHSEMVRLFRSALPYTPWQSWLKASTDWMPEGPSAEERAQRRAVIVVEVEDGDGGLVRARLRAPEAYTMTSLTGTAIAERVLAGDIEAGFQTPSRVYGPDFVMDFPGVSREDL